MQQYPLVSQKYWWRYFKTYLGVSFREFFFAIQPLQNSIINCDLLHYIQFQIQYKEIEHELFICSCKKIYFDNLSDAQKVLTIMSIVYCQQGFVSYFQDIISPICKITKLNGNLTYKPVLCWWWWCYALTTQVQQPLYCCNKTQL